MRNLKRALSLALASVMLLGMMVVGSSAKGIDDFTDKAEIVNQDAVAVTSAIGMFEGYEDGSFGPENVVTRAEMAVIICTMLYGAGVNVNQFAETNVFTDVPAWAEGYVNLCSSLGIVAGVGEGKFDPNATVTTAQAVLMLCRALGYFQNAADFGDNWMLAATAKGTALGLYGDLKLAANEGLTRDNVAELVFNALTKAVPVQYNELLGVYYNENKGILYSLTYYYTDTLGYKNFDLVYKTNENTDYGRPGTTWGIGSYRMDGNPSGEGNKEGVLNEDGSLIHERVQMTSDDEIITVAAGFPTTVTPAIQYGAVPVFVDVTIPQYNNDVTQLEAAYSEKTKAVMIAHTLGNPFDLKAVKAFCDRHNLWLIEDNCDALGSRYTLDGVEKFTGAVGVIGASSFYPPHHMAMGGGGAVYTDNPLLNKIIRSFRDWGRDCVCPSGCDNLCGHRFDRQYGELPLGYDHKYVYSHFGYNLKATDLQASIGCAQLEKFPSFVERRKHNFARLKAGLAGTEDAYILPVACEHSDPSWFGFLLTCQEGVDRNKVVKYVEEKGVQTRMLFAGNLIKHPCFDEMRKENCGYRVAGTLENTDRIMRDTFWVGVYPGMTDEKIDYMAKVIKEGLLQ